MAIKLAAQFAALRSCDTGATAVEYALMITFIALVILLSVLTLGNKLDSFFTQAATLV